MSLKLRKEQKIDSILKSIGIKYEKKQKIKLLMMTSFSLDSFFLLQLGLQIIRYLKVLLELLEHLESYFFNFFKKNDL